MKTKKRSGNVHVVVKLYWRLIYRSISMTNDALVWFILFRVLQLCGFSFLRVFINCSLWFKVFLLCWVITYWLLMLKTINTFLHVFFFSFKTKHTRTLSTVSPQHSTRRRFLEESFDGIKTRCLPRQSEKNAFHKQTYVGNILILFHCKCGNCKQKYLL